MIQDKGKMIGCICSLKLQGNEKRYRDVDCFELGKIYVSRFGMTCNMIQMSNILPNAFSEASALCTG